MIQAPEPPALGPNEYVTWVKVEPDVFDIFGVIVASLGFAGLCIGVAAFCGSILGAAMIIRSRRSRQQEHEARVSISLASAEAEPPPASV